MPALSHESNGVLRTDREYPLDDRPVDVWAALVRVDDYQRWWPWLRRFDARSLTAGERWHARVRVLAPWSLRIDLELAEVRVASTVRATVSGDVEGNAVVSVSSTGAGSTIRLVSALRPRHPLLRALNRIAPPVSRRLHDRVVDTAFRQFAERDRPGSSGSGR